MMTQTLRPGSLLQGGKYKIEGTLGQGGFGITYRAVQMALRRTVAIKEFFMKEYCERDADTSHVTLGTASGAATVRRFREKFLKEAALIAQFDNPHIVRIYDIFEENGTAYYVMEFLENRLEDSGRMRFPLGQSLAVIRQVGDALTYIHEQNVLHLDIKPSNILFRRDCAVLIDFGISKHYDLGGGQTSSTPIGVSKGYAPLEQSNEDIREFKPATDVYSLGATLYKLLTGERPPEASYVLNYGLPIDALRNSHVPEIVIAAIQKSMNPVVSQRYQSVEAFMDGLCIAVSDDVADVPDDSEETEVKIVSHGKQGPAAGGFAPEGRDVTPQPKKKPLWPALMIGLYVMVGLGLLIGYGYLTMTNSAKEEVVYAEEADDEVAEEAIEVLEAIEEVAEDVAEVAEDAEAVETSLSSVLEQLEDNMVYVQGGTFTMGATAVQRGDAYGDESPAHQVTLSSFSIGKYEVTQEEWVAVMGTNPSSFKGARRPVECVSWDDCQEFIKKLNALTRENFRLPTEAEWEFAARGGNKGNNSDHKFAGSNNLGAVAWYDDNSSRRTHEVGGKSCNELGLYDMSGNVYEWCADAWYDYDSSSQKDPQHPGKPGSNRVNRGGCWLYHAWYCRVSFRSLNTPTLRSFDIGLRLAL